MPFPALEYYAATAHQFLEFPHCWTWRSWESSWTPLVDVYQGLSAEVYDPLG